jgi:Rieske Fe-S protein
VGAALLAACGSNGAGSGPSGAGGQGGAGGAGGQGGQDGASGASANVGAPGSTVIALSDVPVDGATAAQSPNGDPLIVAQPTQGQVVAFSAICTHMGCTVAPEGKQLLCPCHGSVYDPFTGKNLSGPAPRPLDKINVRLNGSQVVLA